MQLIVVNDPDVQAQYPHLSPPKPRLMDSRPDGTLEYQTDPGDLWAGHGKLARCGVCGTHLRTGQVHTSGYPEPHATLEMATVYEPLLTDQHYSGALAHELGE